MSEGDDDDSMMTEVERGQRVSHRAKSRGTRASFASGRERG
jgi:hypothetical protein